MSQAKKSKRTVTSNAPAARTASPRDPDVPVVDGSQRAYDAFLPAALAIPAAEVRPFRYDGSLAYHNVARGLAAVLPHEATLRAELPRTDAAALRGLPDLALAVVSPPTRSTAAARAATAAPPACSRPPSPPARSSSTPPPPSPPRA